MTIRFIPIPTAIVRALQSGGPDANGQRPGRRTSDGVGVPCRHCLAEVPAGAEYLILGHRPFPALQPYAECGPIFLCADACKAGGGADLPEMLTSAQYIVRGYGADDRIVHDSGGVVATPDIPARCEELPARDGVTYVHIRSASNTCYQVRVESA